MSESLSVHDGSQDSPVFSGALGSLGAHISPEDFVCAIEDEETGGLGRTYPPGPEGLEGRSGDLESLLSCREEIEEVPVIAPNPLIESR